MTKIYQNYSTANETRLRPGTKGSTFLITSAQIIPYAYEGEDVLGLYIKENMGDASFGYGLMGNEIKNEFMKDMKVGKVEELVGKYIIGFVQEGEEILQGLSVLYKSPSSLNPLHNFSKN